MKRLPLVIILLVFSLTWIFPAQAQGEIIVTQDSYLTSFPTQVKFTLEARSSSDIVRITLVYQLAGEVAVNTAYPEFQPSKEIKTEYVWNTKKSYVPPGVEVEYYWRIEDAAGHTLKTPPKSFVYADTRYTWQQLSRGKLVLSWYRGSQDFGQALLDAAAKGLEQIDREAGIKVERTVKIFIYGSQADLLGALEPRHSEWTGGVSFSEMGIILLDISEGRLSWGKRALVHELTHVAVHQATDNPYGEVPRWLNEGLAMYMEGDLESPYASALNQAIKENRLFSLRSLSSYPGDPRQVTLYYAESYSVVKYLIDNFGREKMAQLMATFKEGTTQETALTQVLGLSTEGLDAQWRESLGAKAKASPGPTRSATPSPTVPVGGLAPGSRQGLVILLCLFLPIIGGGLLAVALGAGALYFSRRKA